MVHPEKENGYLKLDDEGNLTLVAIEEKSKRRELPTDEPLTLIKLAEGITKEDVAGVYDYYIGGYVERSRLILYKTGKAEMHMFFKETGSNERSSTALFMFFAAAARARIVPADAGSRVADRLDYLDFGSRLWAAACGLFGRHFVVDRSGFGVRRGRDVPERPHEFRTLHFDAKDRRGDLFADAFPHQVKGRHALPLVFRLRVLLGVADQADTGPKMVHVVEVVFPGGVEDLEDERPLGLAEFGAEAAVIKREQSLPGVLRFDVRPVVGIERDAEGRLGPVGDLRNLRVIVMPSGKEI